MSLRATAVACLAVVSSGWAQGKLHAASKPSAWVEMIVDDVVETDNGSSYVVLLKSREDGRILPIWIGESEALAIRQRLARRTAPRPLTHDLIEQMLVAMGAQVAKIRIEDLRESTFLGRIFLKVGNRVLDIDARPSDSIAVALGARAPIYAARKVLDQAGVDLGSAPGGAQPSMDDLLRRGRPAGRGSSI